MKNSNLSITFEEAKNMSQEELVLTHLRENGSITPLEAIRDYNITRLAATIYQLKCKGYNIRTDKCVHKNKYGRKTTYAKYALIGDAPVKLLAKTR